MGFRIPNDKAEGEAAGYHCWAYAFSSQRGWIPLDASEGWKNEGKYKEYYLGRIGSDRVAFSVGRDLKLGQNGAPLNYFVYPYAEAGKTPIAMQARLSFKKLPLEQPINQP